MGTTYTEEETIQIAQDLLYQRAMVSLEGDWVGTIAAIPKRHVSTSGQSEGDLNYCEIFIRDNVPVMIYLLLVGKHDCVRHFLKTCLKLQSKQVATRGIFPTSFVETEGQVVADYGQRAIGRVISVDATLWWVILAQIYVKRTGDLEFACQADVQSGIQQFLDLILCPRFRDAPTLYVPDGAFMIDRPLDVWGAPLEIQALLYGALQSAAGLIHTAMQASRQDRDAASNYPRTSLQYSTPHSLHDCLNYARRLRRYLLKHYWVTSKTVQVLRRRPTEQYGDAIENEYNIQTETIPHWLQDWLGSRGGYLIGNVRTGRPDFRFFSLGNCLGAAFDILSTKQQQALFRLMIQNQQHLVAQMPLRICHPPLEDNDWRKKTGYDRKNLPWCYHNGGHWPCLTWFMVMAMLKQQPHKRYDDPRLVADMNSLMEQCYRLLLAQLPTQDWAEYFDGPTGTWMGQQARVNQTWTIVGFLLVHHFLRVNPQDTQIFDINVTSQTS